MQFIVSIPYSENGVKFSIEVAFPFSGHYTVLAELFSLIDERLLSGLAISGIRARLTLLIFSEMLLFDPFSFFIYCVKSLQAREWFRGATFTFFQQKNKTRNITDSFGP